MSAEPHNNYVIGAMGNQFKTNILDKAPSKFLNVAKHNTGGAAGRVTGTQPSNFRATSSPSSPQAALPSAPNASVATRGSNFSPAAPSGSGSYSGRSPQPTQVTAGTPPIKATMTRVNQPSAGTGAQSMSPVRSGLPGGSFNRPAITGPAPRVFAIGSGKPLQGSQFANVTPQNNDPYPTHEHPAGSSNMKLSSLSNAQPAPNDFTVGSRNVKPDGIAAAGSRLEAWAQSKQTAVQARATSRRAGGRDRDLAANAKQAENFSNQPLKNFAP